MKLDSKYFDNIRTSRAKPKGLKACDDPGCTEEGEFVAKINKNRTKYYCLEHIRAFNKNYDFFSGMSEKEILNYQESSITGFRPTWKMSSNAKTNGSSYFDRKINDPFDFVSQDRFSSKRNNKRNSKKSSISKAFDVLEINSKTSKREIRNKYKELVKKFHPDINGQNATNEEKLKDIINAYNELKSSGFC